MQMLRGEPPVGGTEVGSSEVPSGVRRISRAEYQSHQLGRGPIMAPALEKSWFADGSQNGGEVGPL